MLPSGAKSRTTLPSKSNVVFSGGRLIAGSGMFRQGGVITEEIPE
jgi:hypothetical protein